ncbi:MAG: hypothetical protein IPI93_11115 [Sphingobacteriaceae bacterium]|nr:hypothetical protein [Sphingobacteriaceae bacterium]
MSTLFYKRTAISLLVFVLSLSWAFGQVPAEKKKKNYLQLSGVILDQDSLTPIPFVSIMVNDKGRAVSDYYGFFTVVVSAGDMVQFLSASHKTRFYKVDDTCSLKHYYAIQVLTKDTIQLPVVDVYPWPSKDEFKRAFLSLDLASTDYDRADKNLNQQALTYIERTMTVSGSEAYKNTMQNYYTKVYTAGQQPQIQLMNPIAWAQFIDSWRKKNKKEKPKTKVVNKLNED